MSLTQTNKNNFNCNSCKMPCGTATNTNGFDILHYTHNEGWKPVVNPEFSKFEGWFEETSTFDDKCSAQFALDSLYSNSKNLKEYKVYEALKDTLKR